MPKSQYIDPKEMRKAGEITFTPIPVNQYKKSVKDELKSKNFTKEDLKRIYRDMVVIREFETMLQLVKTTGGYNGVEYNNPGPAHLSAGQEAAAVGMAYMLNINDFIFGSHRSRHLIVSKTLVVSNHKIHLQIVHFTHIDFRFAPQKLQINHIFQYPTRIKGTAGNDEILSLLHGAFDRIQVSSGQVPCGDKEVTVFVTHRLFPE